MPKDRSDLFKRQLPKDPEAEHLLVGFFQRVKALVHRKGGVLIHQQLGNVRAVGGFCFRILQRGGVLCPAAVVVAGVACHGEQPRPHILFAVVVFQPFQRPEKGLLGQLLRQPVVGGKPL